MCAIILSEVNPFRPKAKLIMVTNELNSDEKRMMMNISMIHSVDNEKVLALYCALKEIPKEKRGIVLDQVASVLPFLETT
jgi:hypothetical protein